MVTSNLRVNCFRDLPLLSQHQDAGQPLLVVGGGPSLPKYLPLLQQFSKDTKVLAINGAYKYLVENGVRVDYFILIDARETNVVHVENPQQDTLHLIATQCHPEVFEALEGYRVMMFNIGVDAALVNGKKPYLQAPVGAAGIHAIYAGMALGFKDQLLFGYDFSHSETQHHAFEQRMNDKDLSLPVNVSGEWFYTTPFLAQVARDFVHNIDGLMRAGLSVQLYCDGLLPAIIAEGNRRAAIPIEEREKDKYERMWSLPAYKDSSHSEDYFAEHAMTVFGEKGTVIDYGCGKGTCVKFFRDAGWEAVGVDIAGNSLAEEIPFVQAPVWSLPEDLKSEYALCCDVMEHVPPEQVMLAIENISKATEKVAFFNISTVDDTSGSSIGQRLHLTVMSAESWKAALETLWRSVEMSKADGSAIFICRR